MATTIRTALLVVAACTIAGCSSSPSKTSSSTSTVLVTAASFTTVVPTTTSTTTPAETVPTTSAGPLLTPEDAHLVADCVKFIPIGAVLADKEATDYWDVIGRDADELTELCSTFLTTSPQTLASLSLKLKAFEIAQAASTTIEETTAPTVTTETSG